jgi:hypothetical protein
MGASQSRISPTCPHQPIYQPLPHLPSFHYHQVVCCIFDTLDPADLSAAVRIIPAVHDRGGPSNSFHFGRIALGLPIPFYSIPGSQASGFAQVHFYSPQVPPVSCAHL